MLLKRQRRNLPVVFHQDYSPSAWPAKHRFPMFKFRDLASQLVRDGVVPCRSSFLTPPSNPPHEWFLLAHDSEYYSGFVDGTLDDLRWRRIGFTQRPNHEELVRRTRIEVAGTVMAAREALWHGLATNCAGGTHHAHRAWGSGYTAVNDLAITTKLLLEERAVSRVLIIDLDVHQGDGTAEILTDEPRAFTLSVHCATNFPFGFTLPYLGNDVSDLDVALPRNTGDIGYMAALVEHIPTVLDQFDPELVLYDAGVDVHVDDDLGNLDLSWEGLSRRDDYVLAQCIERRIPVACVIGGGYDRDPSHLARRHAIVHHAAARAWARYGLGDK